MPLKHPEVSTEQHKLAREPAIWTGNLKDFVSNNRMQWNIYHINYISSVSQSIEPGNLGNLLFLHLFQTYCIMAIIRFRLVKIWCILAASRIVTPFSHTKCPLSTKTSPKTNFIAPDSTKHWQITCKTIRTEYSQWTLPSLTAP